MRPIKLDTTHKTLLVTMSVVVILIASFLILLLQSHHARLEQDFEDFQRGLVRVMDIETQRTLDFFMARAKANLASPGIKEAMQARDRARLYQLTKGRFEVLTRETPELAVMHFHAPDGSSLLRMHRPEHWGDPIAQERPLIQQVHETQQPLQGLELGRFGLFLRVVMPAFIGDTYVGALEFGITPDLVLSRIREQLNSEAMLLIDAHVKPITSDLAMQSFNCHGTAGRICLADTNLRLPDDFDPSVNHTRIQLADRTHLIHSDIKLSDERGRPIATLVVAQDIQDTQRGFYQTVTVTILLSLLAMTGIFFFLRMILRRMENELATGLAHLRAIATSMSEGLYMLDKQGRLVFINPAALDMLGYTEDELIGRDLHDIIHHTDRHGQHVPASECPVFQVVHKHQSVFRDNDLFWHKDGSPIRVSFSAAPAMLNGKVIGSVAIFHDDQQRLEREDALQRELHLFQAGPVVIFTWRNEAGWPVEFVSPSVSQWGYDPEYFKSGRHPYTSIVHPEDVERVVDKMRAHASNDSTSFEDQYRIQDASGHWLWVHDFTTIRRDHAGKATHFDGYMFEITALKQAQLEADALNSRLQAKINEVTRLSETDALTGIANRSYFDQIMRTEVNRIQRYGGSLSLIIFDVDHFKRINDTHGHLTGDSVLQELSQLIKNQLRSTDHLARWGGEEFVILCPAGGEEAQMLAEKLRAVVSAHDFKHIGHLSCSFGVTSFTRNDDIDSLLARADKALYRAKQEGRNRVVALWDVS